jgi:ribonuclease-3 family protein
MSELPIAGEFNGLQLAYLGDAQIELTVRKRLVKKGGKIGALNKRTDALVCATAQCEALERIMPFLTEEEHSAFRRGKNSHVGSVPKSCTVAQYLRATGFEAIFGYLALKDDAERIEFLIEKAYFS